VIVLRWLEFETEEVQTTNWKGPSWPKVEGNIQVWAGLTLAHSVGSHPRSIRSPSTLYKLLQQHARMWFTPRHYHTTSAFRLAR